MSKHAASAQGKDADRPAMGLYRIVWRWHFYAGLICLPVLALLALTGGLYLFHHEINDALYPEWRFSGSPAGKTLPLSEVVARVQELEPGELQEIGMPAEPGRSLQLLIRRPDGVSRAVYADPASASVLGAIDTTWQWETIVQRLHSLELLGRWANIAVELVAGWAIVLVVSGTYLWWPRGRRGGVLSVRGAPRRRQWWRDVHAVTGATVGVVVLFLAVTGMPWSALWGKQFGALTKSLGLGLPIHVWDAVPQSSQPMVAQGPVPWTLESANVPASTVPNAHFGHTGHTGHNGAPPPSGSDEHQALAIGIDKAQAIFAQAGMADGYTLRMPWGPTGVYSALLFPERVQEQRVMHVDQYSGEVLIDVGYADYGSVAKVTEWGISVHMGKQYGLVNQLLMLTGCLALLLLAVSSVVMWWKRRPTGQLAAPRRRESDRVAMGAVMIAVALGLLFPPLGISMLVLAIAGAFSQRWQRRVSGRA